MRAVVPDLRGVVMLRDTGHWIAEERPDKVSAHLVDFLTSL
ncbi:hypothetical protein [Streptomyces sp. NPDC003710]